MNVQCCNLNLFRENCCSKTYMKMNQGSTMKIQSRKKSVPHSNKSTGFPNWPDEDKIQTSMESEKDRQAAVKSEKDQSQAAVKSEKDQSQAAVKSEKADTEKLIQFMEANYEKYIANVVYFEDFYHAIVELIEKFCAERGQVQYKIPSKKTLKEAYEKHHTEQGQLKREEFIKISKEVIRRDSFTLGKATMDFIMYLFGAPLCALAAKRILPGLGWISDDVVIPLATSASVAYLIRTKQL